MEMSGMETFVGRDSYPAIVIVGYGNPTHAGLDRRGLKSRLRPWKSAQADSARVGFNRLARLEQGVYPRRNGGCVGYGKPTYAALFPNHQ